MYHYSVSLFVSDFLCFSRLYLLKGVLLLMFFACFTNGVLLRHDRLDFSRIGYCEISIDQPMHKVFVKYIIKGGKHMLNMSRKVQELPCTIPIRST